MNHLSKAIVVTGPTATGKTALAVKLAREFGGEIISADSRQVFRRMDLGSGKDLAEYAEIPYHLIDVAEPHEIYHLKRFIQEAATAFESIAERGKLPFFCGGTALYLDAILRGYKLSANEPDFAGRDELRQLPAEELARRLDPAVLASLSDWERSNHERLLRRLEKSTAAEDQVKPFPEFQKLVLGVYFPRQETHRRIETRLDQRLENGMIDEVKALHERDGVSWERLEFFGLEYRAVAQFLQGTIDRRTMRDTLLVKIRQFAKRQDIWFRKMEREGLVIHWVERGDFEQAAALVRDFLAGHPLPAPSIRLSDIYYGPRTQ